jgi:hypothetical protein
MDISKLVVNRRGIRASAMAGLLSLLLAACAAGASPQPTAPPSTASRPPVIASATPSPSATLPAASPTPSITPTPRPVPALSRVFFLIFENREFGQVIDNPSAPNFNRLAKEGGLLTAHYAITHPSFPNYLALISGSTFGITRNCEDCYQSAPTLADQLQAAGKDWVAYLEAMPQPCFDFTVPGYAKRHNPFIYFDSIRNNPELCANHILPFTGFQADLDAGRMPALVWITPDICNSAHDCPLSTADAWLGKVVAQIQASSAYDSKALIVITWDEGAGNSGCCGLAAGGRVATILLSPMITAGTVDDTPYTHYSILATLEKGWDLPLLGLAGDPRTAVIEAIWKR